MTRWWSWNDAFQQQLDPSWTVQEFVFDWMNIQFGNFVDDERPEGTNDGNDVGNADDAEDAPTANANDNRDSTMPCVVTRSSLLRCAQL